jgi:integrase
MYSAVDAFNQRESDMAVIEERTRGDGKQVFRVKIRIKGTPTQTATFERKTDAKRWAQQTEAAIREGRHFKTTEAKRRTLGDLIDRYIESVLPTKGKSEANRKNQAGQLKWWKDSIGYLPLADCTSSVIAEQRDRLLQEKTQYGRTRGPATVVRFMAALSHAFTIAVNEWEWIPESPMRKVSKPKEPRGRIRFLSDEERERLLEACRESTNKELISIVVLALSTGARKTEITSLEWKQVDIKRRRITLYDTKNDDIRVLPLVGPAMMAMEKFSKIRRIDTNLVFPRQDGQKPVDIRWAWETAVSDAKLEDFHFHDLRHSCASYLAMNGASLAELAEVLGHKTLQMVKRYAHLSETHTMGVVERMNQKIFGGG